MIDTITLYYVLANVPANASSALSSMLTTNASQAQFKALLLSEGIFSVWLGCLVLGHYPTRSDPDGEACKLTGLQVTSVELIKVNAGGIVIPVATVETQTSSSGGGISGGAIAGIIIGVFGGLALLGRKSADIRFAHSVSRDVNVNGEGHCCCFSTCASHPGTSMHSVASSSCRAVRHYPYPVEP